MGAPSVDGTTGSAAGNPYLGTAGAAALLTDLEKTTNGRAGDRLSMAMLGVTRPGSALPPDEVDTALAAIALLLAEFEPSVLDGAPDEQRLRRWLHEVDTEFTPGRKLAANAALTRIDLDLENEWLDAHRAAGDRDQALAAVQRLRNLLTDAG